MLLRTMLWPMATETLSVPEVLAQCWHDLGMLDMRKSFTEDKFQSKAMLLK